MIALILVRADALAMQLVALGLLATFLVEEGWDECCALQQVMSP